MKPTFSTSAADIDADCFFDSCAAVYDAINPLRDELRQQFADLNLFFTLSPVSFGEGRYIARIDVRFTDAEGYQRPARLFGFVQSLAKGGA